MEKAGIHIYFVDRIMGTIRYEGGSMEFIQKIGNFSLLAYLLNKSKNEIRLEINYTVFKKFKIG